MNNEKCKCCGKKAHNFRSEEAFECIPPKEVWVFGNYVIDEEYRNALYEEFPMYNTEEVVGSYLGRNPYFPDQEEWLNSRASF